MSRLGHGDRDRWHGAALVASRQRPTDPQVGGRNPGQGACNLTEAHGREGRDFGGTSKHPRVVEMNAQSSTEACQMPLVGWARKALKSDLAGTEVCSNRKPKLENAFEWSVFSECCKRPRMARFFIKSVHLVVFDDAQKGG